MTLPFDRELLRERNALDDMDDVADAASRRPSSRISMTLALSELSLELARSATGSYPEATPLEDVARRYAAPLRAVQQG